MDGPLVSYVVATYNRRDELERTLETVLAQTYEHYELIVVSNSDDGTSDLFRDGAKFDREEIRYFHMKGRMGPPRARNYGYEKARGEIIVSVDDDALFTADDAVERVVERFEAEPDLGVLAFKSVNSDTGEVPTAEFPHRNNDKPIDKPFDTTYFVGVGHAIRREALEDAGAYPGDFLYSGEELDLSFRIIDAGYRILYFPEVTVEHLHAQSGRLEDSEVIRLTLENRIRTSIRNLPWRYVIVSTVLWTGYVLYLARLDPRPVIYAYTSVLRSLGDLLDQRSPVSSETLEYLREHGGRLYY